MVIIKCVLVSLITLFHLTLHGSLFQKHPLLSWGTRCEIAEILNKSKPVNELDTNRLKKIIDNRNNLYWHLKDPYIGIVFKISLDQPIAWNFSLWDYSRHRGLGVKLAIIDQGKGREVFKLGEKSKNLQKIDPGERFLNCDQLHSEVEDRLSFFKAQNTFQQDFYNFHKKCSLDLICQIAPNATCLVYGIMDEQGLAYSSELIKALCLINSEDIQIVHLGLKLIDSSDKDKIDTYLQKIPYIVAASGNDSDEGSQGYPACSEYVAFDVGSYNSSYNISSFSQFSPMQGPKFVAPGENLLTQFQTDKYTLAHGTSMSAALITGFLANVLSEFQHDFSYNQILYVLYSVASPLKKNEEWHSKTVLGAIDMRTALFCFHILKKIKSVIPSKKFTNLFKEFVQAILVVNKLFINDSALESIHSHFIEIAQTRDLQQYLQLFTEIILRIYNLKIKKRDFKVLFDNQVVCLLKSSIKGAQENFCKKASVQAKQKIHCLLHRQE